MGKTVVINEAEKQMKGLAPPPAPGIGSAETYLLEKAVLLLENIASGIKTLSASYGKKPLNAALAMPPVANAPIQKIVVQPGNDTTSPAVSASAKRSVQDSPAPKKAAGKKAAPLPPTPARQLAPLAPRSPRQQKIEEKNRPVPVPVEVAVSVDMASSRKKKVVAETAKKSGAAAAPALQKERPKSFHPSPISASKPMAAVSPPVVATPVKTARKRSPTSKAPARKTAPQKKEINPNANGGLLRSGFGAIVAAVKAKKNDPSSKLGGVAQKINMGAIKETAIEVAGTSLMGPALWEGLTALNEKTGATEKIKEMGIVKKAGVLNPFTKKEAPLPEGVTQDKAGKYRKDGKYISEKKVMAMADPKLSIAQKTLAVAE